ncbi:MAG: hypothetical protein WCD18_22740 [Thermosynechococcaceae cyanobacterium]
MPMERDRYPNNWPLIALAIKQAALWHCQQCGRPCRQPGEAIAAFVRRLDPRWQSELAIATGLLGEGEIRPYRPKRFLLTVAHLDQDPGNNGPDNLKALCVPCHLQHDRKFRTFNRMQKLERQGQLNLLTGLGGQP